MTDRPTVLVTGGAGYIGSHCIRALPAAQYEVVVYDNLSTGHRTFVAEPLVVGDLIDETTLVQVFSRYKIAAVMHFAAASLVGESIVDPQKDYINNVGGTLALLQAMRKAGCHRIVFSSVQAMAMPTARGCPNGFPAHQSTLTACQNG